MRKTEVINKGDDIMKVTRLRDILDRPFTIRDLTSGYTNNDDGSTTDAVKGYDGNLNIRPSYQRNSVYSDDKKQAVIQTILEECPLGIMYWVDLGNGQYEVLDGQQRILAICNYVMGNYSVKSNKFPISVPQQDFPNLQMNLNDLAEKILDYELDIYVCEGTASEKMKWFHVINTAGEPLNEQELRNSAYTGSWLSDAKQRFSTKTGRGVVLADENPNNDEFEPLLNGNWNRQEYLETAIKWAMLNDKGNTNSIEEYMLKHQGDADASELWQKFSAILEWVRSKFVSYNKTLKGMDWGAIYKEYQEGNLDKNIIKSSATTINEKIAELVYDDEVTANLKGIYQYIIYGDAKHLQLREFDDKIKKQKYEEQSHHCVFCMDEGNNREYAYSELAGDHITPWSLGGKTTLDNCQLLCKKHNSSKGNNY